MSNTDLNNPNNHAYWQAHGYPKRPKDWKKRLDQPSKGQLRREMNDQGGPDGRGNILDSMFDPLYKDDY